MSAKRLLPLIICAALFLQGCGAAQTSESPNLYVPEETGDAGANYRTLVLEPEDIYKDSTLSLSPVYDVTMEIAADEPLILAEYLVGRNDRVTAGEPLVRLTRDVSQADVLQAELALQRAEKQQARQMQQLEDALEGTRRRTDLSEAARTAQEALDQLAIEEQQLLDQRESEALTQAIADAEVLMEDVYYYAPFDGIVGSVANFGPGEKINAGTVMMTLNKADSLLLVGNSGTDFFQYGMEVTVEYGGAKSKTSTSGRVVATDRVLSEYLPHSENIYIRLEDSSIPAEKLDRASATVHTLQLKDQMLVPRSAVKAENGAYYVSILEGDTVQKRYILPGVTVGNVGEYRIQVLSGLSFGQQVILD